jgi:peptidoglycan/xylan/chitin deacetylase (PgdA/CDA1 family)
MKIHFYLLPLCFIILLVPGCRTITSTRANLDLPQSLVVFTFDDGPNAHGNTTARVLDVLKKYNIRGMFALLGENAEQNPDLVRRIHDEGHYIINHGYYDKWAVKMDKKEFRENLEKGEAAISAALGEELRLRLYRPQGGDYKKYQERIWLKAGYTLVPGSARAYDASLTKRRKNTVIRRIIGAINEQKGGIILLHDARDSHFRMEAELAKRPQGFFNRSWIPEVTQEIIILLLEKGYRLTDFDVSELPDAPASGY